MIIEVMVTGDETVEKKYFFQKVAGVILDFMATIWGSWKYLFRRRKKIGFSKCRSDHFRRPNRRILGQGIGQNFIRTLFAKVKQIGINKHSFLILCYIPNQEFSDDGSSQQTPSN